MHPRPSWPFSGGLAVQAGKLSVPIINSAESSADLFVAARGSAQLGGTIATNAGGIKVIRWGLTRDWVAGLKVVTGRGDLLDLNRGLVKNNTGYDLRQLFIGSEGTLGIIVAATLSLDRPPAGTLVALAALPSDEAVLGLFERLRASAGLVVSAFECFDRGCYARVVEHRSRAATQPLEQLGAQQVLVELELRDEAGLRGLLLRSEQFGPNDLQFGELAQQKGLGIDDLAGLFFPEL